MSRPHPFTEAGNREFNSFLAIRNVAEATAVILRGLLANIIFVLTAILGCALITQLAYPDYDSLKTEGFAPALLQALIPAEISDPVSKVFGTFHFGLTVSALTLLAIVLIIWALLRSSRFTSSYVDDTNGYFLVSARYLIIASAVLAFFEFQPLAIEFLNGLYSKSSPTSEQTFTLSSCRGTKLRG